MNATTTPPRPDRNCEYVLKQTALEIAQKLVKDWSQDIGTPEECAKDIEQAIHYNSDGFDIAQTLDRKGWQCDAALVEIVNDAWHIKHKHHRKLLQDWVKANNLKGPEIGAMVTWPKCREKNSGIGIVTRNDDDGTSCVRFPDLGHITDEEAKSRTSGTLGSIVAWEDLVPA